MNYTLPGEARDYIRQCSEELVELIETLCRIPAPSNNEGARADFLRDWFKRECAPAEVVVDGALNVICSARNLPSDAPVSMFLAHTDTVFPELAPFTPERRNGRLRCPGAGDDTANLALLMLAARYVLAKAPSVAALFVGNSGEEGLGNLKGCRKLMEDYSGRIRQLVSFDGTLGNITHRAVGSRRYRIAIGAQGGHSFSCFGNSSAIHLLSQCITGLYAIEAPASTTYNVGLISGGTSVNTIAETAEMLYEYRSAERKHLASMELEFRAIIERCRPRAQSLEVELLGERPCGGDVNPDAQKSLERKAAGLIRSITGKDPVFQSGSTDCNLPLSQGIPAIALGGYRGSGAHTYGESIELASLPEGFELVLGLILQCVEPQEK